MWHPYSIIYQQLSTRSRVKNLSGVSPILSQSKRTKKDVPKQTISAERPVWRVPCMTRCNHSRLYTTDVSEPQWPKAQNSNIHGSSIFQVPVIVFRKLA